MYNFYCLHYTVCITSTVQSLSVSDSLQPHEPQHARPPCPSPTPGLYANMSIKSVMPSSHLTLCAPLLLLPSIFPSIRVFSNLILEEGMSTHISIFSRRIPWTAACQASPSITNSRSLLKLMSIESVMPSKYLILCCPLSSRLQSFPASGSFQ